MATLGTSAGRVGGDAEVKVKGPKGGFKAPIFHIDPARRLFAADSSSALLKEVQCFSFYRFARVADPAAAAAAIEESLAATGALETFAGTMYVAEEGLNGQFSVSTADFASVEAALQAAAAAALVNLPAAEALEPIDLNLGAVLSPGTPAPFRRFRVVARPQILTDGLPLDATWDWNDAGEELSPEDWHFELANPPGAAGPGDATGPPGCGTSS